MVASPENAKRLVGGSCLDPLALPRLVLALLLVVKDGWLTGDFLAGGTPNKLHNMYGQALSAQALFIS